MTTFRTPFPIVYVADVERSAAFYCEAFGFELTFRWPDEGPTDFAALDLGPHSLGLARADGEPLHRLQMTAEGPARFELCVYTEDTDAAAERLRALGAPELLPPTEMPWQERLCYFADPDGNPLHVTQKLD